MFTLTGMIAVKCDLHTNTDQFGQFLFPLFFCHCS